jgi:hypothetical protein
MIYIIDEILIYIMTVYSFCDASRNILLVHRLKERKNRPVMTAWDRYHGIPIDVMMLCMMYSTLFSLEISDETGETDETT